MVQLRSNPTTQALTDMGLAKAQVAPAALKWNGGSQAVSPGYTPTKYNISQSSAPSVKGWGVTRYDPDTGQQGYMTPGQVEEKWRPQLTYGDATGTNNFEQSWTIGNPSGGDWASVNQWNDLVSRASAQTGVPANVIKAIMKIESQGNPNALSSQGYYGLMQTGPDSAVPEYMKNREWLQANPFNQILAGATELMNKYNAVGRTSWEAAAGAYLGYGVDANGTSTSMYQSAFSNYLQQLNAASQPGTYSGSAAQYGGGAGGASVGTTTNAIIERLKTFVGIKYRLGAKVPGGANPLDYAGWDCSGLTKWLDQTYGTKKLPGGAHYQYQYAQQTGKLFTDLNKLQPGDIIFIHGTFKGGAGAWLNDCSHVGVYLGNNQMISAAPGGTAIVSLDHYPSIGKPIMGAMHLDGVSGGIDTMTAQANRYAGVGNQVMPYGGNRAYSFLMGQNGIAQGNVFGYQQGGSQGFVSSNTLQTMFGGKFSAPDWGGFNVPSDNRLYGYGVDYGLNGDNHTGIDVPNPTGTPLYAPAGARVICAGTGNGLEGCAAFNDYMGNGAGRIELEMPDGVRIIYGHSSTSSVRPGQTVSAGTMLGTSGGMNSPHTHLEVRVPDSTMPSGYRIVDPVAYFGGMVPSSGGATSSGRVGSGNRAWDAMMGLL